VEKTRKKKKKKTNELSCDSYEKNDDERILKAKEGIQRHFTFTWTQGKKLSAT